MRIEAYNQVQQVYNHNNKSAAQPKSERKKGSSDQLQISTIGKDIQTAKAAIAGSSDIREDVIAPLKAKIKAGVYDVSMDSFAEKLAAQYNELREMR